MSLSKTSNLKIHASNSRPRIVLTLACAALILQSTPAAVAHQTGPQEAAKPTASAQQVIDAYVTALGGAEALAHITSRKAEGRLEISNRNGDHEKFVAYWRAPDFSRVSVSASDSSVETGFDGKAGWRSEEQGVTESLRGQGLQLVLRDANPLRYARLSELYPGVAIDNEPPEDAGKQTVLVFRSLEDTIRFYFDPQTHLLTEITSEHSNDETGTHRYQFEDYRKLDGVLFPFAIREIIPIANADPPAVHIEHVLRFRKVQNNVTIPDSLFSPPR